MDNEDKLRRALLNDEFPDSDEFYNNQAFSVAPENRLKFERNAAVAAWMTGAAGREVLPTGTDWQSNKDALAQGFFKIPTAKDMSDESIHDLIRSHIQTSDNTTNLALESALSGRPLPQALSELHALTGVAKTRGIRDRYLNAASGIYGNIAAKVTPYRGLINEAAGALGEKMRAEDQPLGEMTDAFNSVAEKLAGIPEQDRRLVIEAIAATGGTTAEERSSYLSKMGARVNRIAETMGAAVMSNASTFGKVLEAFPSGLANKPDEVAAIMQEDTKSRELVLLAQQIRTAAADKLDPVKGNSWLQNQGLAAAEMATQSSIAIANPLVAFGANLAYFRDTIGADAMTQNPGMTVEQSDKVSAVAAPVNAAIETVTALIPWGKVKLPVLQKWLMSETASVGGAARNFGVRAITGTGAEIGEEWLQAYAPLKAQELMSGLKQDMPSVDWEKNMPKFADIAAEVWAPALLFSLVGGGVASINDIKNGRSLASDLDMLVAKGVAPETAAKIKEASDAGDYNKVDSLFRAEFVSETKASKPDIEAATERLKARFKAQENVEALTETTSPEYTASVTRTPSGWQVTTGDGTIIPTETAEGANRIYNGLRQVGSQQEANVIAEVLDTYFESGMGRGAKVEMTGEDVEANRGGVFAIRRDANNVKVSERPFGPQALETVRAEAEIAGIKAGASGVIGRINGSNEIFGFRVADTVKAVWRKLSLFKSSKEGNSQIFTLLHEDIESKLREGLRDGTWSEEDVRTAFRALAPAFVNTASPIKSAEEVAAMSEAQRRKYESELEDRNLEYRWIENVRELAAGKGNYTMLQETFSEMYVRDRFAKDRRGKDTGFKPMQISRALEAAVVGANTNEEASALVRIIAVFRALSAHLKAVFGTVKAMVKARDNGTIGEDWDAFVDKVLGIDEVKRDEGLAMNEAQAILEDSDMPFSISPASTISVPTSDIDTIPEDLARAEADMKAGGKDWASKVDLSQPVGVYRGEDGRLKLFDGHHRWLAARERGEPLQVRESVFGRAVPIGEAPVVAEMPDGAQLVGPATFSITAYHGTPHKVDKFRLSKIGTGEGAQAYGWGLYFAENREVGEQYRDEVTDAKRERLPKLKQKMVFWQQFITDKPEGTQTPEQWRNDRAEAESKISKINQQIATLENAGNLYTVELLPDEDDFLDWDKPLSEQSEKVKAALASTGLFTPRDLNPPANFVPSPLFNSGRGAYDILKSNEESDEKASKLLASLGIAGMKYFDGNSRNIEFGTRNYVIFDESLVKILEENGQKVEGQSFSISPIRNLNELSDQVERQFAENPVEALEVKTKVIRQFTKIADKWSNERWTPQGNKIRPISDKRTVKSLDKEQAMRQAQREVELVNEGIDKLTPETLMAWSQGVDALDDHPLIQEMLGKHGKLMSLKTAQKEGKDIKDQYDDAPWIPPQWYAKSGGIMPDVMADNLKFGYAKDMWAEIESVIKTYRDTKEGYAKAEAAVKAVEKAAFEQARKEAQAWRDEADAMQKEDWSPKESLVRDLITLESIRAMFPQEIRDKIGGFVTLARKASESARLKVLQKQLERGQVLLEKHLKEQYNVSLLKMLNKAAPVGKPGEVKKSKFIVTVQDELDAISEIVGMDSDGVTESIATNEAAIISAQTPEAADVALTRLNLLELFGGILDLKRTSSQEMEVAHEYLAKLMKQGREARKIIDEARSAKVKEMVTMAKADAFKGQTGPETTQAARAKAAKESGRAMLRKFFGELSGFDAVLRDAFGPKSETARSFSERFTLNSNDFEDVQNERRTRFRDFARELYQTKLGAKINQKLIKLERIEKNSSVTYLKNREVKTHKFTESDAAKIVADPKAFGFTDKDAAAISEEIQAIQDSGGRRKVFTYDQIINDGDRVEIPLSQMDAVYISMALRQPGILEQQERHGYDQQTVDELDKYLTDEAKAWRRWMQTEYDAEYQRANEVYMRMFNARMPMIMFYAPLLKNHQGQQAILDPLNTGISSNSANPGSIKTRKGRTSSLRIESALTVFWAHFNQMEYWIANAEYLRDVQAVLLNPEVRESVVASHGEDGMATISAWIQLQMSRGVGKAALATAGNKIFRNVKTGLTMKALALSYTTALKTLPSVFYSLGEIHMSKWPSALTSGMKHWNRLWKTNIIQRRLDIGGMPELRDLGSSAMPMSWMNQLIKYGSAPAMYADGVFTTFSAAMAYGVNYDEAIRQGASEDLAHKHAEERTALIVSRTAQPENWTQKSLLENDVGAFGSMFTLFMSDPRQKMALTGAALNQFRKGNVTGEEAARKFLAYWVIPGIMFQLANAIGRSLFKGDDDEWEVVDFATAALVGQLQGLVLLGSGVESIFSAAIAAAAEKITGEEVKRKPFWNSSKNPLDQAAQDLIKSAENLNDTDKDVFEKTWEVIKSAGMLTTWLNPAGAVPATVERVIKDTTNLFYGAEE